MFTPARSGLGLEMSSRKCRDDISAIAFLALQIRLLLPPLELYFFTKSIILMGRGDKRSTKGKIRLGSHGKTRNKKTNRPHPPKQVVKKAS